MKKMREKEQPFPRIISRALVKMPRYNLWPDQHSSYFENSYNHGQKSWDKFPLLALLRTRQTQIQLHLSNFVSHPPYNVGN